MKTYTNDTNDGKLWLRFFVVVWHVQQKIFGGAGFTDCSPTHPTVQLLPHQAKLTATFLAGLRQALLLLIEGQIL